MRRRFDDDEFSDQKETALNATKHDGNIFTIPSHRILMCAASLGHVIHVTLHHLNKSEGQ